MGQVVEEAITVAKMNDTLAAVQDTLAGVADGERLVADIGRLRDLIKATRDGEWIRGEYLEGIWTGVMDEGLTLDEAIAHEDKRFGGR